MASYYCTSYAAYRVNKAGTSWHSDGRYNAYQWDNRAREKGIPVGGTPKKGDVAVWEGASWNGGFGHVAYVESVNPDGSANVSEYNYKYNNFKDARALPGYDLRSSVRADEYIHFKDLSGGSSSIANGDYIQVSGKSTVYRVAGGAPLAVYSWSGVGGSKPVKMVSQSQFDALPKYPKDGTVLRGATTGKVYIVAGGAPMYVYNWSDVGGSKPTTDVDQRAIDNKLRGYPSDGTVVRGYKSQRVYQVINQKTVYVSDPSQVRETPIVIDDRAITNKLHPVQDPFGHLDNVTPVDGGVQIRGWAIDPDTTSPIRVDLYGGNGGADWHVNPGKNFTANVSRPDVGRAYPRYGDLHGYAGFFSLNSGQQTVCAYAINASGTPGSSKKIGCKTITIQPQSTTFSLTASPKTLTFGQKTTLSGKLSASDGKTFSGQGVILQQKPAGANSFRSIKKVLTKADGTFRLSGVKLYKNTTYRARFAGNQALGLKASTSPGRRVNVKVVVTEYVSTHSLRLGRMVVISGRVLPSHTGRVSLSIRRNGKVFARRSVALRRSAYHLNYKPPRTGRYSVRASFSSDSDHLGNHSPNRSFLVSSR